MFLTIITQHIHHVNAPNIILSTNHPISPTEFNVPWKQKSLPETHSNSTFKWLIMQNEFVFYLVLFIFGFPWCCWPNFWDTEKCDLNYSQKPKKAYMRKEYPKVGVTTFLDNGKLDNNGPNRKDSIHNRQLNNKSLWMGRTQKNL